MRRSLFVLTLLFAMPLLAEDKIELEGGTIIGNTESPKALYIVPWRPLAPVDVVGLQVETLLDEELEPVERQNFQRQMELYELSSNKK
jgi:hypothetical protein